MKLKNLLMGCALMIALPSLAQPSDAQVINEVKSGNAKISKVTIGSKDTRLENGIRKHYISYSAYIDTEYPGVQRVYRSQRRYVGNKLEKKLVGNNYYVGIKNPNKTELEEWMKLNKSALLGNYANKACNATDFKIVNEKYFWSGLNYVEFEAECYYYEKKNNLSVNKVKFVRNVIATRSMDGKKYDPKAKLALNGKWITNSNMHNIGTTKSADVVEELTYSQEEYDKLKSVSEQALIDKSQAFLSTLPDVTIPQFKSDKDCIQYLHELMIEGDKLKIEAVLNQMCPDNFFTDKPNAIYTGRGADFVNHIVNNAEVYKDYFCKHPQIKHEQYAMIQFYTRSLESYGRIQVFQVKDGSWRTNAIEFPYGKGERLEAAKSAGEKNCGEPIFTGAPVKAVQYTIGDRVMGQVRGQWYSGTVNKIDDINGQWITADLLKKGTSKKESTTKTESTTESTTTSDKSKTTVDKTKSKIKGLKGKIKIP